MYIGHRGEQGKCQALSDHLANVSNIAGRFGAAFNAEAHARRTGTLHDAGKYSPAAQRRMADPEHTSKVDHSTAGAKIALEQCRDGAGALAIAGHHGGMPDFGGRLASAGDGTLLGRMKKDLSGPYDYAAFWQENDIDKGMLLPGWLMEPANRSFQISLEKAMAVKDGEVMPVASPVGYPAEKKSIRESLMRKGLKADDRKPFDRLFFVDDFNHPLPQANPYAKALEMARWAPSAANAQPWRAVVDGDSVHFYEAKTMKDSPLGDIQKVDVGIALAHFDMTLEMEKMRTRIGEEQ